MRNKTGLLIAVLSFAVTAIVCPAEPVVTSKESRAKALELIDKYAATQDAIYKSFVVKFDISSILSYSDRSKIRHYLCYETLYDGKRFFMSRKRWGNFYSDPKIFNEKDDYMLTCWLWNEQRYGDFYLIYGHGHKKYNKSQNINNVGQVSIYEDCPDKAKAGGITDRDDYWVRGFYGTNDIRIDKILRVAKSLTVADKLDAVGTLQCYVIEAVTKHGKYKVWIAPEHGYNIARIIARKAQGDLDYGQVLEKGATRRYYMQKVQFKKISDIWVPIEAETGYRWNFPDGQWRKRDSQYKRTEVVLNPIFDENDFVVPKFANGWKVMFRGYKDIHKKEKYTWQNGHVLDADGREVDLEEKLKGKNKKNR